MDLSRVIYYVLNLRIRRVMWSENSIKNPAARFPPLPFASHNPPPPLFTISYLILPYCAATCLCKPHSMRSNPSFMVLHPHQASASSDLLLRGASFKSLRYCSAPSDGGWSPLARKRPFACRISPHGSSQPSFALFDRCAILRRAIVARTLPKELSTWFPVRLLAAHTLHWFSPTKWGLLVDNAWFLADEILVLPEHSTLVSYRQMGAPSFAQHLAGEFFYLTASFFKLIIPRLFRLTTIRFWILQNPVF